MVAASAETIGVVGLCKDMGIGIEGEVYADSNAAIGIAQRSGKGKVRHLRVQALWVQEVRCSGRLTYKKVLGSRNPADILTKHVPKDLLNIHLVTLGLEIRGGRADTAPSIDVVEAYTEEWEETLAGGDSREEETGGDSREEETAAERNSEDWKETGMRRVGRVGGQVSLKVRFNSVVQIRPVAIEGRHRSLRDARAAAKRGAATGRGRVAGLDRGASVRAEDPG